VQKQPRQPVRGHTDSAITKEIHRQNEQEQADIRKQLKHAQQHLDLTNVYPGRKGRHLVNLIVVNAPAREVNIP
jgi:hypothetical protein